MALCWEDQPLEKFVEKAWRQGFDYIELSMDYTWPVDFTPKKPFSKALKETGLRLGVHAPWAGMQLAHYRERLRQASINEVKESIALANSLEAVYVNTHFDAKSELHGFPFVKKVLVENAVKSAAELKEFAEENGVIFCVENEIHQTFYTINELKPIVRVTKAFCLDVGHAVKAEFEAEKRIKKNLLQEWMKAFEKNLFLLHLHDCVKKNTVEDHHQIGIGFLDFKKILLKARNTRCKMATIEAFNGGKNAFQESLIYCKKLEKQLKA